VIENEGRTEEEWNLHFFNQLAMEQAMVGRREARSHDPKPLVGRHDRASKWHKAISTAHSDAVVIARSRETPC
jgi:hypothetical protein